MKGLSQNDTKKDSVCFSIDVAAQIMADLDKLEICLKETKHLNTVLIPALKESIMITSMELEAAELEIKDLITELNDKDTRLNKARKSRLYWGVGGALAGAVVYSILAK